MERWTGQANGTPDRNPARSSGQASSATTFRSGIDPNGALTQVNSLATAAIPNLPPGTLPPVVLPFDPTSTTPVCMVALDSPDGSQDESILYDVGRYEVRNMIMSINGAIAPVVYGGKIRAVMAYLDRQKMQARGLSPLDVMNAMDKYNVFLPAGDAKIGDTDYALDSNSMYDFVDDGRHPAPGRRSATSPPADVATPRMRPSSRRTSCGWTAASRFTFRSIASSASSTLAVVQSRRRRTSRNAGSADRGGIRSQVVMDQSIYVRQAIASLVQEGVLGAVLCSLVILLFLGQWRMTVIAVMTMPVSVLAACTASYALGQTINVMTLAGLALAVGPMVDSAIICLENTHRHLGLGAEPAGRGVPRGERGGDARTGLDPVYLPRSLAAGIDAGHGRVPVPADDACRGVCHVLGLHPVADARSRLQRGMAEWTWQGEHRDSGDGQTHQWARRSSPARSAQAFGAGKRRSTRLFAALCAACSKVVLEHRVLTIGDRIRRGW